MADSGEGLNMGEKKEQRMSLRLPAWASRFYVMTYGEKGPTVTISLTSHSAFYPFYLYLILYKGVKWIWHVWEGEGHNLGNQKALYQWLHWQNSMRLIPQRPGQSFCRGLRESISEITSPIEKTANESLQTLCILEEQRSFHWRVSLSCPSMFWSELYLMLWIKRKLPGKRKAKMGKG